MSRKSYLLMFLLILIASDTSFGGRHFRRRRCPCPCPCQAPEPAPWNYCLQELYMDFGSGDDLFECYVHEGGCDGTSPRYSDLFYGTPTPGFPCSDPDTHPCPQSCLHNPRDCETDSRGVKRMKGHGQTFPDKDKACAYLHDNYPGDVPSDWECKYYKFKYNGTWIYVVIEPAPKSGNTKYFGIETGDLGGTPILMELRDDVKPLPSGNLEIKYKDGNSRKALIWRK